MRNYNHYELEDYSDWQSVITSIQNMKPKIIALDTETTGLDIIRSKPFLIQFGFLHPTRKDTGYTFLLDLRSNSDSKKIFTEFLGLAKEADVVLGHNIKFDLHMLHNIGIDYREDNLSDTQFYIRYGCDALHQSEGGPPLGLKDFAAKYIDPYARDHEKLLQSERSDIAKRYNKQLKDKLGISLKILDELFSDPLFEPTDLPQQYRQGYMEWFEDLPKYLQHKVTSLVESDMIRYADLNTEVLYRYSHLDIVYTLEIYEKMKPIIDYRKQQVAIDIENSCILPYLDMESTGFLADKAYLAESKIRLKNYIIETRKKLTELAGQQVSIGQHAVIKKILREKYDLDLPSTGNAELEKYSNPFIDTIKTLRTLEKWYTTYILRFEKSLKNSDRLYTSIQSVGTVSGRVTSDFQQFPKNAIYSGDTEIFHPRKLILTPPECTCLAYIDYSQIELRFQAMYTILVGHPDLNMCRAYMPYKCHDPSGHSFDYLSQKDINNWDKPWYLDETNELWTPTDVHAATTEAAGYSRDDPNFSYYRKTIGKKVNFAKNYGASLNKIIEMFPDRSLEECKKINDAYYTAFPGVKEYHQYCFNRAEWEPCTANMFGVKYYGVNGHKLRNVLVQGSAAHFLKQRQRAIWEFLNENDLKSRMQMCIHDENVFEIAKGEEWIIPKLKEIMEDWDDALVPIVAEVETTETNWGEKHEYSPST